MNEGKTSRYFKYAIGEIALVVIGILLALSINNWNESRKLKAEETKILMLLLQDLKNVKLVCETQTANELKNLKSYEYLLGKDENRLHILKNPKIDSLFYRYLWGVGENTIIIGAITEIQNSGNSAVISNENIRKRITSLDLRLQAVDDIIKDRLTVQQLSIDAMSLKISNFRKLVYGASPQKYDLDYGPENDYETLINKSEFLNAMAIKLDLTDSVISKLNELLGEIKNLINEIEIELKTLSND